jgi:hypothetical protein
MGPRRHASAAAAAGPAAALLLLTGVVGWALSLLVRSEGGSWRACVLSYAWCTGDGAAVPSPSGGGGELARRAVVATTGAPAVLLNCAAIWRVGRRAVGAGAAQSGAGRPLRRWLAGSAAGQLGVAVCLLVPMSCAALQPAGWAYLGWNDVAHDCGITSQGRRVVQAPLNRYIPFVILHIK